MRWWITLAVFLPCLAYSDWNLPNMPENGMGDPGNFYLPKSSVDFGLLNDDYIGSTDKLMTGSSFFSVQWESSRNKYVGYDFAINHRFLTPITKTRFKNGDIGKPLGWYGDELEPRFAVSRLWGSLKVEASLGLAMYADFGAVYMQNKIHKMVNSPIELYRFGPLPRASYLDGSLGGGTVLSRNFLLMNYISLSPTMNMLTSRLNFKTDLFGSASIGAQAQVDYLLFSHFYQQVVPWHWGAGFSFKWHWYQFTTNYSSIYVPYDRYGQFFLSPLIINIEF